MSSAARALLQVTRSLGHRTGPVPVRSTCARSLSLPDALNVTLQRLRSVTVQDRRWEMECSEFYLNNIFAELCWTREENRTTLQTIVCGIMYRPDGACQ